jgi:hypothetical protein
MTGMPTWRVERARPIASIDTRLPAKQDTNVGVTMEATAVDAARCTCVSTTHNDKTVGLKDQLMFA